MKLTINCPSKEWREPIEKEAERRILKLEKLLQHFAPDLVTVHGTIEKNVRKEEYEFCLNVSLPTGTLHATGSGTDVLKSVKASFAEIEKQTKKHVALLRKDYEWKRKRPRVKALA